MNQMTNQSSGLFCNSHNLWHEHISSFAANIDSDGSKGLVHPPFIVLANFLHYNKYWISYWKLNMEPPFQKL